MSQCKCACVPTFVDMYISVEVFFIWLALRLGLWS